TNANATLGGDLHWLKKTWTNDFLPNGFTNEIAAIGSTFQTPGHGVRVMNFTNFSATFSDGNLTSPLTQDLSLTTNNTLTFTGPNSTALKLQLNLANGLFSGSFRDLDFHTNNFRGALLQTQNFGAGFFFTNNASGSVLLQATP